MSEKIYQLKEVLSRSRVRMGFKINHSIKSKQVLNYLVAI